MHKLIKDGVIIPPQDWGEKFEAKREAITVDWFERHPECKRGNGEFTEMYPKAMKAISLLTRMSELKRITTDEYLVLFKGIHSF